MKKKKKKKKTKERKKEIATVVDSWKINNGITNIYIFIEINK